MKVAVAPVGAEVIQDVDGTFRFFKNNMTPFPDFFFLLSASVVGLDGAGSVLTIVCCTATSRLLLN